LNIKTLAQNILTKFDL